MATANYIPGDDPAVIEANRKYQEAYDRMSASLDARKNRTFDPSMLALASGFLAPTQTGGFGESLGKAMGNYSTSQQAQFKEDQDMAKAQLDLAGQGVQLQRQKQSDRDITTYLGGPKTAAPGALTAAANQPPATPAVGALTTATAPTGGPLDLASAPLAPKPVAQPVAPEIPQTAEVKPAGFENVEGVQIMPPNPAFLSTKDYVRLNRYSGKPIGELIKEGQELELKAMKENQNGVTNLATGKFYATPTGKTEKVQIYGQPGSYDVDAATAAKLSAMAASGDPAYYALADRIMKGPVRPGAPSGDTSSSLQSTQQLESSAAESKTRAEALGKSAAAKEAGVEENDASARRILGSTSRVLDQLGESGKYYGLFQRPGISAAIFGLVQQGIRTPGGSIAIADVQNAVTKLMPGVKQADIDNIAKSVAELTEIELAFTRLYLSKQGAVTEGERKLVRAIPGDVSNSPSVLKSRMEMLNARSQFDIDVNDAWSSWKDKNPEKSYLVYERSPEYKNLKKDFEIKSEEIFGGIAAIPSSQRKTAAGAAAPSKDFMRDPKTGVIRRKREGE